MKRSVFIRRQLKAVAALLLCAMICAAFGSCGVIILNDPSSVTGGDAATTLIPESSIPPESTGEVTTGEITEEQTDPPETTKKPEEFIFPEDRIGEAEDRLAALTDAVDISGYRLIVIVASDTEDVLFSNERSPLYAARTKRNKMLHDKYGVEMGTIYDTAPDSSKLYEDLLGALNTGESADYYVDMLILAASDAGRFLAKGLLMDMKSLPFYNINEGPQAGNIGRSRYFDLGAGTDAPEYIHAIYFNRTAVGPEGEKALYGAAFDGTLSWETLIGVSKSFSVMGGDSALPSVLAPQLLGIDYITKDASGKPQLALSGTELSLIDSAIGTIRGFEFRTPAEGTSASDDFISGKSTYYLGTLSDIFTLYDKPVEWGILPLPSIEGTGAISDRRPVVCIPVINDRPEPTAVWLSGFNAASGDWIRDQLLSVSVKDYMRDNNSCILLSDILSRKTEIGFSVLFADNYDGLEGATFGAAASAFETGKKFSEIYSAALSAVNKRLEKLP